MGMVGPVPVVMRVEEQMGSSSRKMQMYGDWNGAAAGDIHLSRGRDGCADFCFLSHGMRCQQQPAGFAAGIGAAHHKSGATSNRLPPGYRPLWRSTGH